MLPTDVHPDLSPDRLKTIVTLLVDARNDSEGDHKPKKGETLWSLGCRALERSKFVVVEAALVHRWLRVIEPSNHFRFLVGSVPMAFYRGTPERHRHSTLRRRRPERQQTAFAFIKGDPEHCLRLAIETDRKGRVSAVTLVQFDVSGTHLNSWQLFSATSAAAPTVSRVSTVPLRGKASGLPRPTIVAKGAAKKKPTTGTGSI